MYNFLNDDIFEYIGWSFTSLQHLRSYQDWYRLVTLHTHVNFIVLPNWETRPLAPLPNVPLGRFILTLSRQNCLIKIMLIDIVGSKEYVYILGRHSYAGIATKRRPC